MKFQKLKRGSFLKYLWRYSGVSNIDRRLGLKLSGTA
jgi:hypothetical protein